MCICLYMCIINTHAYVHACIHTYVNVCVIKYNNSAVAKTLDVAEQQNQHTIYTQVRIIWHVCQCTYICIFTLHTHIHTRTDDGNVSVWTRRSREEFSIFHCNFALGLLRARHIHIHTLVYVDMCIQTHTHTRNARAGQRESFKVDSRSKQKVVHAKSNSIEQRSSDNNNNYEKRREMNYMQQKLTCAVSVDATQAMNICLLLLLLCVCVWDLIEFIRRIHAKWRRSLFLMQFYASMGMCSSC